MINSKQNTEKNTKKNYSQNNYSKSVRDRITSLAQLATAPLLFLISKYLGLTVAKPASFSLPPGTLIIGNHQSKLDPFLICYHLSSDNYLRLRPFRFPVDPDYMERSVASKIIALFGGYNIGRTHEERAKNLLYTRGLLRQKRTVILFPEGKLVKDENLNTAAFERGGEVLFAGNFPVVFVRLMGLQASFFESKNRPKVHIHFSPVYESNDGKEKTRLMQEFFNADDLCN